MNPLTEYIELTKKYIVRYGENNRWTPLQINKVFLQVMIEMGIIVPFSIGRNPVISPTQQMLHMDYANGLIHTNPTNIFSSVASNSSFDLGDCEDHIDIIYESFEKFNLPYIWELPKLKSKIKRIKGSKSYDRVNGGLRWHVERIVDNELLGQIDRCQRWDYIHPSIEIQSIDKYKGLGELCDTFKELKMCEQSSETTSYSGRGSFILHKIKDELKSKDRVTKSVKTTEPRTSSLKYGKTDYVINSRYLEFIREHSNGFSKPIIVSKNNDKFMVALGKIHKDRVPPSWSELYFFNVNEKDEEEIKILSNHLEQFMVILIAEKIKISEDWKEEIVNGVEHLERGVIKTDDEDMLWELGTYGGEVYASTLSVSGNTVNFSMSEHIIEDYIKKVIVKLTKAIGDSEVYSTIKNNKEIQHLIGDIENEKDTISRLKLLEEGLRRIYSDQTGVEPDIARPIYLLDIIKNGKINCEGYSALALYLITFNKQLFPEMDCIKICCVPIMPKYGLKDPHMFLILGHNGYKQIFDPTTITYGYKDKIISEVMGEERYYVDHKIIEIKGEVDG